MRDDYRYSYDDKHPSTSTDGVLKRNIIAERIQRETRVVVVMIFMWVIIIGMILFAIENVSAQDDRYLPSDSRNRTVYKYHSYSLLYDEATEQAAYVAYELTRAEVSGEYERPNISFRTDSKIKTGSATSDDY